MRKALLVLLLVSVNLMAQTVDVAPATPVAQRVRAIVEAGRIDDASFGAYADDVRSFYAPNGFATAWTRNGRPTAQATATINLFERADAKGLRPFDYAGGQWQQRLAALRGDDALARFDVAMTVAAMRYASDVRVGRVNPKSVRFDYSVQAKQVYLPGVVAQMVSGDANAVVAKLEPQSDEYRRLVSALATWRTIAAQPDVQLPVVNKLNKGATYEALPQLAEKLRRFGDLAADAKVLGTTYEGVIVEAVKHFQSRHGLDADGVVSKKTFAALNVPAAHRVRQIELAMERARWMPEITAPASIVVNIPEFRLEARGTETIAMRVVVGKASSTQTPVFGGDIKHVVFRPYWSVPPSIQRGEIVPKLAKDRGYLAKHNYEVVDGAGRSLGSSVSDQTYQRLRDFQYTVRQKPGTSNALGLMKFLFPNDNNVYLHSTPQQALFARTRRDFSHGCIRVEDPAELAEWVLRAQPEWSREKIDGAMKGKRGDVYVKVERPIAVVLFYATAVAEPNGEVKFLDDIYGHDVQLAKMLEPAAARGAVLVAAR